MNCGEYLKILCGITAVTGREHGAASRIAALFEPLCDEVRTDRSGNVFGTCRGEGENPRTVLVTAHYDEIGLVVTGVEDSGFLRFSSMGGIDPKSLPAQEVTVFGRETLYGVIGAKPPHLLSAEEMDQAVKMDELRIDIGFSGEEAKALVRVGDVAGFRFPVVELKNNRMACKGMDNRAGVAMLLEMLQVLSGLRHADHVVVAATVQEEVGLRGAVGAAFSEAPDLGIVIDVCHADMPDAPPDDQFPLGKGVAVAIGPVVNAARTRELIELAKRERIPVQLDPEPGDTGTEAAALAVAREGIPTLLLSIPCRYMHTTVETISLDDVMGAAQLAARYIAAGPWKAKEGVGAC
jgi:putative aminopeptidase FrvX